MIKAVVFDLDGVLVDAVQWHYLALNRALKVFGYEINESEHASLYNGLPTALKLRVLTQRKGFPESLHPMVKELKQQFTRAVISESLKPSAKITSMIHQLKAQGYKLAVASNSVRETVELMLSQMEVLSLFDVVLSNEDVVCPKPDPEIYKKTFQMLGVRPNEAIIVEDSIPGIQAARQSCQNVVVVTGPHEVGLPLIEKNIRFFEDQAQRSNLFGLPEISGKVLEILIPMAGNGQRFADAGYDKPKPLIEVMGKPMIQWVVENVRPRNMPAHFTFLCRESHLERYPLREMLKAIAPNSSVVGVPDLTEGAAATAMLASQYINNNRPLLIANSDQWVNASIDEFLQEAETRDADGSILTFPATDKKWSYAKLDKKGKVVQVAEKNPISENATVGIYYFKRGSDFISGAKKMIFGNVRTNGEFYLCPVYNELIAADKTITIFPIPESAMHGLGTPEDLAAFLATPPKFETAAKPAISGLQLQGPLLK